MQLQERHTDMVAKLAKSGELIASELQARQAHWLHMAIGISGEAGELFEAVYKNDRKNVKEELGDSEFYMEGLRRDMGMDLAALLTPTELELPEFDLGQEGYTHAAVHMMVEANRLLDAIKKAAIYNKEVDAEAVYMHLTAMYHLMSIIRDAFEMSREEVLEANYQKLRVRYDGLVYSDTAAQVRADKQEVEEIHDEEEDICQNCGESMPQGCMGEFQDDEACRLEDE